MLDLCEVFGADYDAACRLLEEGDWESAKRIYKELSTLYPHGVSGAVLENDLGVLKVLEGKISEAIDKFENACQKDSACKVAAANLDWIRQRSETQVLRLPQEPSTNVPHPDRPFRKARIAIMSLLFNWPSTGGGTIHTAELGQFLKDSGYEVHHWYAKFSDWGLGNVLSPPLIGASEAIEFNASNWSSSNVIERFSDALAGFRPDLVIITDSWNFKPLLAEASEKYPYFLRLAALECLCPLNNVRLLIDETGRAKGCSKQQFATPADCLSCVNANERSSGWLHHRERALAGFGTPEYDIRLRRAFAQAAGVLVVNPLIAAQVEPYAKAVHVIPSGFDSKRFPAPQLHPIGRRRPVQLFFAGLVGEYMKGFHILHAACRNLWAVRQDFELVLTADPADGPKEPFLRYIGWQSQTDLPSRMRDAAIVVFPTIAEEALGRSAVEAMGVARPVIASRIGGLPFTVIDEVTGLLFEPGNVSDLMSKIVRLLDSPELSHTLGLNGRQKFEREFTWDVIIERHYRPLFGPPVISTSRAVEVRENRKSP